MSEYNRYRLGRFLSLHLPLRVNYGIATSLAYLHYLASRRDREAVKANLHNIKKVTADQHLETTVRLVFKNFGWYLVEFFRLSLVDRDFVNQHVAVENLSFIDKALEKKRGGIIVTAHIGNWELGGVVMATLGYPVLAVALTHKDRRINEFFNKQRLRPNLEVTQMGNAFRRCIKALKENKLLALPGDRDFQVKGLWIDLFGRPTLIPRGPAELSIISGAPIIPGFLLREKQDKFRLVFEHPIYPQEFLSLHGEEKITACTTRYLKVMERYIENHPDQWLMFREYWIPLRILEL